MNDRRRREGFARLCRTLSEGHVSDEGDHDELQSNQRACGRADNYVEVLPSRQCGHLHHASPIPRTFGRSDPQLAGIMTTPPLHTSLSQALAKRNLTQAVTFLRAATQLSGALGLAAHKPINCTGKIRSGRE